MLKKIGLLGLCSSLWAGDYFVDTYFTGSGWCGDCHNQIQDQSGQDISIQTAWSSTMMAQSARDPYWQAKVAAELNRNPALSDEINITCSRCHMPMANETAIKKNESMLILDTSTKKGWTNPAHPEHDLAMDGVSCTLCHQIQPVDPDNNHSGQFVIDDYILDGTLTADRPIFGQYASPLTQPMRQRVQFTPTYASHISDSSLCSSCHDLLTPYLNEQDQIGGEFAEQMVYSEWKNSLYAQTLSESFQSCQDCHMPKLDHSVRIASQPLNLSYRSDFALHDFIGANTVMLDILDQHRDELNIAANGFQTSILKTQDFLRRAASIQIGEYQIEGNQISIPVTVNNLSGHKLPSGYPSRRVYIHFIAKDDQGQVVFESGALNSDGSIQNAATDSNSQTYEPHYDQIDSPQQVQIYEPIMGNSQGQVTHTLLRAARYLKDNRLLPLGFDKAGADAKIAVYGRAAEDDNFQAGSDQITYRFDLSQINSTQLEIKVELHYQALSYGYLQDLFQDDHLKEVAQFKNYFEQTGRIRDELIAEAKKSIPLQVSPGCSGQVLQLTGTISGALNCAAEQRIEANFDLQSGSRLHLSAPLVEFKPGLIIRSGAELSVQ